MKDKYGKELTSGQILEKGTGRIMSIVEELEIWILHVIGMFPSHHVRRFFYRLGGMEIGRGSSIHMGTILYDPKNIIIGKDSIIGERAVLDGRDELSIGDHVAIASEVMIYNSEHDIHDEKFSPKNGKVVIEDYVFVGPRAIILPGVTIGKGAVVAAGAVVTKNVLPMSVVGGIPAKEIKKRAAKELSYTLGRARWFR